MPDLVQQAEELINKLKKISNAMTELGDIDATIEAIKKRKEVYYLNQATLLKRGWGRADIKHLSPHYFEGRAYPVYHIDEVESYEAKIKLKPKFVA